MHRRRLSVSSVALCAVLLGFTTVSCSATANQVNAGLSPASGTGTVSASSSQGAGPGPAVRFESGCRVSPTASPRFRGWDGPHLVGLGSASCASSSGSGGLPTSSAPPGPPPSSPARPSSPAPAAEHRCTERHRHAGTERHDVPCGGRDAGDRRAVPVAPAPPSSNPVGPGARDLADVDRVPARGRPCTEPPRTFLARTRGTAQIAAHAEPMCGDARRCVHADGRDVEVTVIVVRWSLAGAARARGRAPRPGAVRTGARPRVVSCCQLLQLLLRQGCEGAGGGP